MMTMTGARARQRAGCDDVRAGDDDGLVGGPGGRRCGRRNNCRWWSGVVGLPAKRQVVR